MKKTILLTALGISLHGCKEHQEQRPQKRCRGNIIMKS